MHKVRTEKAKHKRDYTGQHYTKNGKQLTIKEVVPRGGVLTD